MNDKDRDAFEVWFDENCTEHPNKFPHKADRQALKDNWHRVWQAALAYLRKENKELLEKCKSVLGMVYHINDVDDESVIDITANAKELILELNTAGIGKE